MPEERNGTDIRIRLLQEEIEALKARVSRLEGGPVSGQLPAAEAPPPATEAARESRWSAGGVAAVMSRGATVSLVLLLALVLRTLTDGGVLSMGFGTLLGIAYATLLEAVGFLMYRKGHPFAPLFSISGVLLLVAVVLEAHTSFGSLPTIPAYGLLAVAAGGMAFMSRIYRIAVPVSVGTMAVLLAGIPMDFPNPHFPSLAVFLIIVNIMAFTAAGLPRCSWLRIVSFSATAAVVFLWAFKLRAILAAGHPAGRSLGPGQVASPVWFFVLMAFYVLFFNGISVAALWRKGPGEVRPFDNILPTAATAWGYLSTLMVVLAANRGRMALGWAGVVLATALLGIAALKARGTDGTSTGINTFAFPAAFLLALSFRDVSGESVVALAILAWAALSLAWLSGRWQSDGVRVTSYFLQVMVLGASLLLLAWSPAGEQAWISAASMAVTAAIALAHYRQVRRNPPPSRTAYFTRFDRKDISGVAPLMTAVGTAFLALRSALFGLVEGYRPVFQAGETVIINLGALVLFVSARARRNAEMKWLAVLVVVLGGGKVFLHDLFRIKGVPIVLSVLAFGAAAATGSLVLGRWYRQEKGSGEQPGGGEG